MILSKLKRLSSACRYRLSTHPLPLKASYRSKQRTRGMQPDTSLLDAVRNWEALTDYNYDSSGHQGTDGQARDKTLDQQYRRCRRPLKSRCIPHIYIVRPVILVSAFLLNLWLWRKPITENDIWNLGT